MGNLKRRLLPFVAAGGLILGMTAPAAAAPVVTGGLINVTIVDAVDIERFTVQLPIAAAANVCNVSVLDLLARIANNDPNCTADADSRANR